MHENKKLLNQSIITHHKIKSVNISSGQHHTHQRHTTKQEDSYGYATRRTFDRRTATNSRHRRPSNRRTARVTPTEKGGRNSLPPVTIMYIWRWGCRKTSPGNTVQQAHPNQPEKYPKLYWYPDSPCCPGPLGSLKYVLGSHQPSYTNDMSNFLCGHLAYSPCSLCTPILL